MVCVILDIETTGLSPYKHKITEIAAAKVSLETGEVIDRFSTLVNPETPIPKFITRITGITDEMVVDAPLITDALRDFISFVGDIPVVAHNASFDMRFLKHFSLEYCGHQLSNNVICTKKLANRLASDVPSKKLECLCEYYDIVNTQAHRAMADVEATVQVFLKFKERLAQCGDDCIDTIFQFQDIPTKKALALLEKE